ncbi:hypothetical protein GGR50DRAFT_208145 [Xylaria sp. CBS 124048]|nr:hypothetical protein GGR50DRAFT_208145 [Xylaria sp. CBS 124048]
MAPKDRDEDITIIGSGASGHKSKKGRTPLKQLHVPRSLPPPPPPCASLKRKRKRLGGKRTVRSCTSCRAAHVRCVADRYGVPCERCAKKAWSDCTLMQKQSLATGASADPINIVDRNSSRSQDLKQVAADAVALLTKKKKRGQPRSAIERSV